MKVHPVNIEKALELSPLIKQAAVFGSGMPFLTAVIVSDEKNNTELRNEIKKINSNLNVHSQIKGFIITHEGFSNKNGFITSNLKLDRKKSMNIINNN